MTQRSALVTGGTGAIGQAIVRRLAADGLAVTFQYRSQGEAAERLADETGATAWQVDPAKFAGELAYDVLVNAVGTNPGVASVEALDRAAWQHSLDVNLTAPFRAIQAVLPGMKRRGWGRIVNISSIYGLSGAAQAGAYVAAKHGLAGLTRTVAKEAGAAGVTCNEISPGPVDSPMIRGVAAESAGPENVEAALEHLAGQIPQGRLAQPADVAAACAFLVSEGAGYLNGVSLPVDGGQEA